jgi:transcriptional repressor NrdR
MHCPACASTDSKVIATDKESRGDVRRRRECKVCGARFSTVERIEEATPLLVKQNGDREQFDRAKLINGIRMACAKRAVPAAAINSVADEIEAALRHTGADEVPSRTVGDMVVRRLRDLDEIAYIRYALIYLGLDNLESVRSEIDRMLAIDA